MEVDPWGFFLIIAFLLGMGTPRPWGKKNRRNGTQERRQGSSQVDQVYDMLGHLIENYRAAEPDNSEDPEDGPT